jgi:glycosyltransferase involved in cell wall biosynthesis
MMTVSVVVPVYFNAETLGPLLERLRAVAAGLPALDFELLLVDDGSRDASFSILKAEAEADARVRVLRLSRNFGSNAAILAGLSLASGECCVVLAADLQDPPELIPRMLEHWRAGTDVVYAVRRRREGETRFKLATARWFYKLFDALADVPLEHDSGDFRLLDRAPLDALLAMRERNRFLRGMTVWIGYTQTAVPYERDARQAGETKYTLRRMVSFSLDAISSFSHRPLQLATIVGFLCAAVAFVAIPVVIALRLAHSYLPGFGTITIAILLLGGMQLMAIGLIGEYLGRIYDEVKGRPLYLVRTRLNMPEGEGAPREPVGAGRRGADEAD